MLPKSATSAPSGPNRPKWSKLGQAGGCALFGEEVSDPRGCALVGGVHVLGVNSENMAKNAQKQILCKNVFYALWG